MASKHKQPSGGMVSSLTNVKFATIYIDPDYTISARNDLARGETSLLGVFYLLPSSDSAPSFHARIDDGNPGNRKTPELDIDIKGVTKTVQRNFKGKRNGYAGHHTDISPDATHRAFKVKVSMPNRLIYEGEVSFNAHFSITINTQVYSLMGFAANLTVNRRPLSRVRTWMKALFRWS